MSEPGRSCPLRYRCGAGAIARAAEREVCALYVVGGLYGNVPALDALASGESAPTLCCNGDFNWFNAWIDDPRMQSWLRASFASADDNGHRPRCADHDVVPQEAGARPDSSLRPDQRHPECRRVPNTYLVKPPERVMSAVLVSTKGQIVLPVAVRKALGLKPGMRVDVRVEGKGARITPAPVKHTAKLAEIQAILMYSGPRVAVEDMRVTDYRD